MRRAKLLIVILFLAAGVGSTAFVLYSGKGPVELVRDQPYGPDRRIVVLTVQGWSVEPYPSNNRFQARLRNRWTEPAELFGQRYELACIVPLQADRCRLMVRAQRDSPSERVSALFTRCGLTNRFPKFCDWIICHVPSTRPPVRDVVVETSLPRFAHNLAASADAPIARVLHGPALYRRATDQRCYV